MREAQVEDEWLWVDVCQGGEKIAEIAYYMRPHYIGDLTAQPFLPTRLLKFVGLYVGEDFDRAGGEFRAIDEALEELQNLGILRLV